MVLSRHTRKLGTACAIVLAVFCMIWIRYHPMGRTMIVDFIAPFLIKKKEIELSLSNPSALPKTKIELIKENERLNEEVTKLKARVRELNFLRHENSELRKLTDVLKRTDFVYTKARIVSRDPASGGRRVRIDRGATQGIAVGQPVLANGYLYGRVLETSDQTALILTVIDPNCKISVKIAGTNIHGILEGQQKERWKVNPLCIIKYLPRDYEYKAGMKLETSTLGTIIPPRIPVGELIQNQSNRVTKTIDNLYKIAYLKPLNLLQEINFVLVVTKGEN